MRNAYPRAVSAEGNTVAQQALADVFTVTDRQWRGIGMIPRSGWTLSPRYAAFDAELKFGVGHLQVEESAECHSGEVLQGLLKPNQCPAFGKSCTPRAPLGATMVSSGAPAPPTTSSGGWGRRPVSDPAGRSEATSAVPDPTDWVCPLPLRETKRIVLGHGGGGILSEELIENLFLPPSARPVVTGSRLRAAGRRCRPDRAHHRLYG